MNLIKIPNLLVTAVDKHYWEILPLLPKDAIKIVMVHDPMNFKNQFYCPNPLVQDTCCLLNFKVYTIRNSSKVFNRKFKIPK